MQVFCSRWLADPLISFGPKFFVTAFEGLVHIHQGRWNYILKNQNFDLGFVGPCNFTHSNESTKQMQQLITSILFVV
jgi:hypothetical protein